MMYLIGNDVLAIENDVHAIGNDVFAIGNDLLAIGKLCAASMSRRQAGNRQVIN